MELEWISAPRSIEFYLGLRSSFWAAAAAEGLIKIYQLPPQLSFVPDFHRSPAFFLVLLEEKTALD